MATLLENLVIDRVDLCDEGANSEAFIELFKRKEQSGMGVQEILGKMKPEHSKVIQDAFDASTASLKEAQDSGTSITKERDEANASLEATKKELEEAKKELEDLKAQSKDDDEHPEDCDCPECRAKRAEKDRASSGNASFDSTETFKSLPQAARDYLATLKTQKEAAEAELRKSREEKVEADAIAKAQSLKAIPVDQDKLVGILKTATPELIELLEVINGAIEGTVLGEVGKSASDAGTSSGADAWSKIEAKAAELAKSSNISKAKAVSQVIRDNPDLYREYLEGGAN
jgi:chromosome segregation ATPase